MPTTSATIKTELSPKVQAEVRAILSTYADLKQQFDLLDEQIAIEKAKLWDIAKREGVTKFVVDGMPAYEVAGTFQQLDKAEFVRLGGDLKVLEMATKTRPKKAYFQVGKERVQKGASGE